MSKIFSLDSSVHKSKKEISTMQYFGSYRTSFNRYRKIKKVGDQGVKFLSRAI